MLPRQARCVEAVCIDGPAEGGAQPAGAAHCHVHGLYDVVLEEHMGFLHQVQQRVSHTLQLSYRAFNQTRALSHTDDSPIIQLDI